LSPSAEYKVPCIFNLIILKHVYLYCNSYILYLKFVLSDY
jgi:hypothetical protein